jgi:hypothetical protein
MFETTLMWRNELHGASFRVRASPRPRPSGRCAAKQQRAGAVWGSPEMLCDAMQQLWEEIRASEKRFATAYDGA